MFKLRRSSLLLVTLFSTAPALLAQRGCFHSPEAPTDVLMVVGAAGMFYGSGLLRKLLARRKG